MDCTLKSYRSCHFTGLHRGPIHTSTASWTWRKIFLRGVAYLHSPDIANRDNKPQNVLIKISYEWHYWIQINKQYGQKRTVLMFNIKAFLVVFLWSLEICLCLEETRFLFNIVWLLVFLIVIYSSIRVAKKEAAVNFASLRSGHG